MDLLVQKLKELVISFSIHSSMWAKRTGCLNNSDLNKVRMLTTEQLIPKHIKLKKMKKNKSMRILSEN